ncbi:hypothetical protein PDESU_04241 [Pontiella desulfatans]|uniref:Autotransporter domain-containing protein n=1 Tax=Pontiella desulfatans TaxID=2750659 RepID=A0A6C2U8C2_PONDE|nr:hypothetical protein [Pontiella desulfatans]VGO15656.1 hypothetical protein PDESU_04241 [Pontiella desulfatans]
MNRMNILVITTAIGVLSAASAKAQQTWSGGATGTWDTVAANWDGGSAWGNGSDAVFGAGAAFVQLDSGVAVGNLTLVDGVGSVDIQAIVDDTHLTLVGSPTWDLGTNTLHLVNTTPDTHLSMASGNTLTVIGAGEFNAGERPNDATTGLWDVSGSTLDFQAAVMRGNQRSVGEFDLVKMAGGSKFINERNSNQTYANNWELGSGEVTFDTRFTRASFLDGIVSGSGRLVYSGGGSSVAFLRINNPLNSFGGGVMSDGAAAVTSLQLNGTDDVLGAVPATFDPDNIILKDGGIIEIANMLDTMNPNRGITLDGGGVIIPAHAMTLGSPITGTGGLTIGVTDRGANVLTLTAAHDYEGNTTFTKGSVLLGASDLLPAGTVVSIGGTGGGTSALLMNGFDQTLGGLTSSGTNTKLINNDSTTNSTLTLNVTSDKQYGGNITGTGLIDLVKEGSARQAFLRASAYTTGLASLTINEGFVQWNSDDPNLGLVTVNAGGKIGGSGWINDVVLNSGSAIAPGYWVGSLNFRGDLDLSAICADNAGGIQITFDETVNDRILAESGTITLDGLGMADFTFGDNYGLVDGVYTVMTASAVSGTLDPADLAGAVGSKGATGSLSVSGGSVLLTVAAGDYSPFGTWTLGYGLIGDAAAADADPDADRYSNIQEYAFGGDPTNAAVQGHAPVGKVLVDGTTNWLTCAYGFRSDTNSGVSISAETTDNLVVGTWTTSGVMVLGTGTIDGTYDTVTNGIPMDGTSDFLGIFVEQE